MNMNGAFSLCTSAICTLILACIAAAREESVEVEWGTGKFTIQCYPAEEDSSAKNSTYLYWYRVLDGEEKLEYVQRSNGSVTYKGENPISGVLNDYGSMTLEADYTSDGKYKCTHRSGHSFYHTLITVRVIEPPLRVLGCNSTSDANHSCKVTVRSDTETLTFNVTKAGIRGFNGYLVLNASHLHVVESNHTRRNDDNSTTISAQYVLNVSGLTSSMTLHFAFYGKTKREFTVQLIKSQRGDKERQVAGISAWISAGIIVLVTLIVVVVVYFVKYRKGEVSGQPV